MNQSYVAYFLELVEGRLHMQRHKEFDWLLHDECELIYELALSPSSLQIQIMLLDDLWTGMVNQPFLDLN